MRRLAVIAIVIAGCSANAPPYAMCVDGADCAAPSDGCYRLRFDRSDGTEADGNVCSKRCTVDRECPEGGACIALAGDPSQTLFCASRCTLSPDCYAGLRCTAVTGATVGQVCLP